MQDTKDPYLRESKTYIDNADFFIKQHEYDIAGNFLRKEAEAFCKEFLPKKWHYTADYSNLDLCGLISNCKKFAKESDMADRFGFSPEALKIANKIRDKKPTLKNMAKTIDQYGEFGIHAGNKVIDNQERISSQI